MYKLTISLAITVLQLSLSAWAQPTLIPPSTFGSETLTTSNSANTSATTTTVSGGSNGSSATPTSSAQFPSLSGYSTCITNCLAVGIAAVNCSSVVDVNCFCDSQPFARSFANCISDGCPGEIMTGETLAQQFCNLASTSLLFPSSFSLGTTSIPTSTPTTSNTPTNTAPTSATTTTGSTITSNAASQSAMMVGTSVFFGIGTSILAVILGACLVG